MLKIDSLHVKQGDTSLINTLSFQLQKGENLTILGNNGSGKSTLAKLLCGLLPSQKSILLQDQYLEETPMHIRAQRINYMPAKFSLFEPYLCVSEYLQLSRYKATSKEKQMHEILHTLGLFSHIDSLAQTLSSGEQQLLQLASCMLQSADITIFDEPTSNLDPQKTKIVFDVLALSPFLKQKILITHDLQLAFKLGFPILHIEKEEAVYYHNDFFEAGNLARIFGKSIMIVDNNIVECL